MQQEMLIAEPLVRQCADFKGLSAPDRRNSSQESPLLEQLARATTELRTREAEGQGTEAVRAVIRSLRRTLARQAELKKDPDPRSADLVMRVLAEGEAELWHRGIRIPVDSRPLRDAFLEAGVAPASGQALLVDPELARHAIEESLVEWSLQELRLRRTKSLLLRTLVDLPTLPSRVSERNPRPTAAPSTASSEHRSRSAIAIA